MTGKGLPAIPVLPEVPADRVALATRIRALAEAAVLLDEPPADLDSILDQLDSLTATLRTRAGATPLMVAPVGDGEYVSINNPVEGPGNPLAPPLTLAADGDGVRGEVTFTAVHEGPPGRVHGGWVAAVLDHAAGRAVAAAGYPAMTVSLTVDFRAGTPYGTPLWITADCTGRAGRKVFAAVEIRAGETVTATATATLVVFAGT